MGSKKKTTEQFKQEVYDLVGNEYTILGEYVNNRTKIKIRHETCGNEYEVRPYGFIKGNRCPKCNGSPKGNTEQFKQKVYELVGDEYTVLGEYINNKTKIKMKHNICGNEYEVTPDHFKSGHRCKKCSGFYKRTTKQFKQEVYDLVGDEYTVLGEYIGTNNKIKMKHNICGYEYEVTPNSFKRGNRCPKCANNKKTTEQFKQEVYELFGKDYTVLSEYVNCETKIKIRHETCGTEYEVLPNNFLNSKGCKKCYYKNKTKSTEQFKQEIYEVVGDEYTILGDYINNKTPIKIRHEICGTEYEVSSVNFLRKRGRRCPKCALKENSSKAENEICEYLSSLNLDYSKNNRDFIKGQEIDILVNNVGIEYDGLYWHSDLFRDKNYHLNKTILAKKNNIRLIHIFEDEWEYKQDIVKSKLLNILGISNKNYDKIYARKCIVKEIKNSKIKNNFLNKNHIQGEDKSNIKLGLYYNEELVSVMTFVKPRRALGQTNTKYDYELSRFASRIDLHVVGAFSKLFKYFERNYEWKKLITYADKRWSEGNVYIKNGWNHIHDSSPNYWYCDHAKRYHRYNFRKQVLKEKFPELYDPNLTEFEIMSKTNYNKIWDCGNMVFEYKRK